ncbi:MAG: porin family protein [Salibacteraceae bacterium]
MKKFFLIAILVSVGLGLSAQNKFKKNSPNLPYFEEHKFHFGFTLAVNSSSFKIKYNLTSIDSLISLQVGSQSGFNIGFMGSMRFNDNFSLRFLPTLAFAQRNFDYVFEGDPRNVPVTRIVESTYVMFPLLLKYRSQRYNNFAAYVVGGLDFAIDLSSQFDVNNEVTIDAQVLKVQRQNLFAETGVGFDFFLEYFKFAVEFKYSHGINDVFVKDNSFWAIPIEEIKPRMFTVSLLFEG